MNLREVFNNGDIIRQGNNYDEILAGLTMQPSEAYDTNFVSDVSQRNFLLSDFQPVGPNLYIFFSVILSW